jgi:1-acyl-sn-glycerol-3-phosphate acyltransferase
MIAYQTVKTVAYPIFRQKISAIHGLEHLPTSGSFVIAANHVDWLDGFYIAATIGEALGIPVYFLTKSNNYWWTQIAIQIPPEKKNTVEIAVEALRSGKVICNFPEGQRNSTNTLLPGKTGSVRMAALAGVPIIPLGIQSSSKKNMAASILQMMQKNHCVEISIGPALSFSIPEHGVTEEWLKTSTHQLMGAIAPLCHKRT